MKNEKNNNGYDNENYLNKRMNPSNTADADIKNKKDEIENKTEEKFINPPEKNDKIKPTENADNNELKNDQREMHPEVKKKKNKDFTMSLILGAIILVIAGIVVAYLLLNTQKEDPRQIIKSAMQEMQTVKTYNYNGTIELDVKNKENSESFNFDVELFGKTDQTDLNNIKAFNNLKIVADISAEDGSQEFSFDLDAIQLGQKKAYLKLNDFDLGVIGMMMGPEVSSLKEKWYELDLEELEKLGSASPDSVGDISSTTYDINKIMGLYNKYELLKFQEDLGNIELGNINVYHYKVKLDGIALINFYTDVMKEMVEEQEFNEMFGQIEEDIEKYNYIINEVVNNIDMEVWIGKEDKMIYRTKMNGRFDKEFIEMLGNKMISEGDISIEEFNQELENDFEITFDVDLGMNNFNQPVEINEPENAENLMEVINGIFGGFLGAEVTETELDTDEDGLPDYIENLYGTDLNNPDTDGDGYTDGEETESGYDPLIPGNARIDYDKLLEGM